jgi:hypothetical protein
MSGAGQHIFNGSKFCTSCRESLPLTAFRVNPKVLSGLDSWCKGVPSEGDSADVAEEPRALQRGPPRTSVLTQQVARAGSAGYRGQCHERTGRQHRLWQRPVRSLSTDDPVMSKLARRSAKRFRSLRTSRHLSV